MNRWKKAILGAAGLVCLGGLVAGMVWYLSPLFITHPEQDACSFGEVSNAEYRELLEIAKRHAESDPDGLSSAVQAVNNDKVGQILQSRFERVSSGLTTIEGRIAAAHAVLRAIDAEYREAAPDKNEPFSFLDRKYSSRQEVDDLRVTYVYASNIVEFGKIRPFDRIIKISFVISVSRDKDGHFRNMDGYYFAAFVPGAFSSFVIPSITETSPPCPPVPTKE